MTPELRHSKEIPSDTLLALYASVGWTTYTKDPAALCRAVASSTYVVSAWQDGRLVGLARALSDDVSILYVQDLLVAPTHRRQGIGRRLLEDCLARYAHVRQTVLLTDAAPAVSAFYRKLGLEAVAEYREGALCAFVRIR